MMGVNNAVAETYADFHNIIEEVHAKLRRDTSLQLGMLSCISQ